MKQILITITLLTFVLSACAFPAQPSPDEPVSIETPSALPVSSFTPNLSDGKLMRGEAFLDSVELLTLESFPLQFVLVLKGSLPTPCHQLRVAVSPPDIKNKIVVDVYSVTNPDLMCVQVIEPFEANHPLGSFSPGKYTLWVNGIMVAEFQS